MRSWLIIVLLCVISCSPKTLPPAEPTPQMVEQADRIILEVNDGPKENYQNIARYLTDQGFRLHVSDASSLNIKTAYKPLGVIGEGVNSYIRINASVMDTVIYLSGEISSRGLGRKEIKKIDGEDNLYQQAWQKLVEIAEGYPHEEMFFSRN